MAGQPLFRDADPPADADGVWSVLEPIFRRGDTYAIDAGISRDDALAFWFDHPRVRVAVVDGWIAGTYYLGPNQAGGGRHVANCGYTHTGGQSAAAASAVETMRQMPTWTPVSDVDEGADEVVPLLQGVTAAAQQGQADTVRRFLNTNCGSDSGWHGN